jgi:C1A family cysteine protease
MSRKYRLDTCLFETSVVPAPTLKATKSTASIPQTVDLRGMCSPVEDQLHVGSCAANAAVGALEYHQRKAKLPTMDLSRLFVYYNARNLADKAGDDCGTLIPHVMASVMAHGACEERLWPYIEAMWPSKPTNACYENAMRYEAVVYARTPLGDECLLAVAAGLPVVFGTAMPGEYYDLVWAGGQVPQFDGVTPQSDSGHAMLIVGYDIPSRTWLVRNSWGDTFGEGGYFRIPFSTLSAYSPRESFWTIGAIDNAPGVQLGGMGVRDAVRATSSTAKGDMESSLDRMRKNIRKKLNEDLDQKKKDLRGRLRGPGVGGGY